jgi:malate synthase
MEDAATAEIARAQLWQWIRHPAGVLEDGRKVSAELVRSVLREELAKIRASAGAPPHAERAAQMIEQLTIAADFEPFLTLPAYAEID